MRIRLVAFVLVLLVVPASTQRCLIQVAGQAAWPINEREIKPEPPRDLDPQAARIQSIHRHAEELSTLNVALQSQLQQLQRGMLPKELPENLKKIEKLSKKLRQEMVQ